MKRYKVYTENIFTKELSYLGEVWADTLENAKCKASRMFDRDLEAYDTLVVEKS